MSHHKQVLTSVRNPKIVELAKLHDARRRRAASQTLVEGPHQVADVLASGAEITEIFRAESDVTTEELGREAGIPVTTVGQSVLRRLAGTDHPRGPVAVARIPEPDPLAGIDTVVLWEVADPGNAGAIIRTAAALGYAVAVSPGTVDVWSPKVVRAAAATQFGAHVSALPDGSLSTLESAGLHTIATVAVDGRSPDEIERTGPVAILIGNEARGLPGQIVAAADQRITIPLQGGVESLNAAVAAGLVMYALRV